MALNSLGREIPEFYAGKRLVPYGDAWSLRPEGAVAARPVKRVNPGEGKRLSSLREALEASGLADGMTIATHHSLRNGDFLLNRIVAEIAAMGLKGIWIASSSVHPVHAEIIPHIKSGVIAGFQCGVNGLIGELASRGELSCPIVVRTHGGRARSIIEGSVKIDVAFIAAPCCDEYGNMNGYYGPSACGSLGYAQIDASYASCVVAVTDNLVPFPAIPVGIPQTLVDYVVVVDRLGDPAKIVSTTTRVTTDPVGLQIASYASQVIEASGLLQDGFSFQTGSGGISLAVAEKVRNAMRKGSIKGSFGCGGITGYFVEMLEEGLFSALMDVQCFDQEAVRSIGVNRAHQEISADMYANPFNAGSVVNRLDCVILGATEVDTAFNVNVNTESNGYLLHNTGGHSDTAAGAKLSIIVAPSIRGRLPIVRDRVTTITTPGDTIGVVVTERGIAVNDRHAELKEELVRRKLPVKEIADLQREICRVTGTPRPLEFEDEVVAVIEYRDGSIIDVVRRVKE
ncbi:citrate lyase subunit alpha [Geomonas ferrireducens]|uniref:citrate lyase subunit alpha n=1 Tax=Geomonas ferrireducens TaxID=2570227 RepID=UPI0010A7AA84|nr:citrate lyase subunit alpha [Geomonas ferrireducens]